MAGRSDPARKEIGRWDGVAATARLKTPGSCGHGAQAFEAQDLRRAAPLHEEAKTTAGESAARKRGLVGWADVP